jgi:hypothetical protein
MGTASAAKPYGIGYIVAPSPLVRGVPARSGGAMSENDGNWDNVEAIARRQKTGLSAQPAPPSPSLAPINEQIQSIREQELDIIGRFKRNGIDRKAALEKMRVLHSAQLEAAQHALKRAVDVEKMRVDTVASKYIFQIQEEYLLYMEQLGLTNHKARMETLLKLNETTTALLKKAEGQDVPPSIRDATITTIFKKHDEFAARLADEEIRSLK